MTEAWARLPLSFEENRGQTDAAVRFLARGFGFTLFLTEQDAVLAMEKPGRKDVIRMRFSGANPHPAVEGLDALAGRSNYFRGPDPSAWRTNVSQYRRVRYAGVYPGIDLIYYGNQRKLEYDLVLSPGADPKLIRFRVDGAKRLTVSEQGDLLAVIGTGELRLGAPYVYQKEGDGRKKVDARYELGKGGVVQFAVAGYDRSRELVIDPTVLFASFLGGLRADVARAAAVDSGGNLYLTGATSSTDFPNVAGSVKGSMTDGDSDAFVIKLNPAGTTALYATFLGGTLSDYGRAITVDGAGSAYVTGSTVGRFPTTAGAWKETASASPAIFAAKLDSVGSTLLYATYLDGAGAGNGIAVDSGGNAYIAGHTYTATFTTSQNAPQRRYGGSTDAFVVKVNPTGTALVYATFHGGQAEDQATGIAIDANGAAYLSGFTSSTDFPVTAGAYRTTLSGAPDAFLAKLNAAGTAVSYSTYLGGAAADRAYGIAVNTAGEAVAGGQTASTNFPTTSGAYQTTYAGGGGDGFVSKLNSAGTQLLYSTFLGGNGSCSVRDALQLYQCDAIYGIVLDPANNVHATGIAGAGFPTTANARQTVAGGGGDAFLAQLNAAGTALVHSTFLGGAQPDAGLGIAYDSSAQGPAVAGFTDSTGFPADAGSFQAAYRGGSSDAFFLRPVRCTVTLGATESFFPAAGGSYTLEVFAASNCFWTAAVAENWVTITSGSGSGNGTIAYTVAPNTGPARNAFITVDDKTYQVKQVSGACVSLSGSGSWFPSTGGLYLLGVYASCPWTTNATATWIHVFTASGNGDGSVMYSLDQNTGAAARFGQITVGSATFNVNQVGAPAGVTACEVTVSRQMESVGASGAVRTIAVTAPSGCPWAAVSSQPWVGVVAGASGAGPGSVTLAVAANDSGMPRFAQVAVGTQTVTVTQEN
jgi:hypothetical protein